MCGYTCAGADILHPLQNAELVVPQPHTKFPLNPPSRSRDTKKRCARDHVQLCPTLNFCKSLANGSLATYRISAQSVKPFPIYGKGGTSALAHVQVYPILACVTCLANWSLTTYQISAQSVRPVPRYGKGVRTCRCTSRADAPQD